MAKNIFTRYDNIKKLAGEGSPYAVDCYMQYVVKFSKDDRELIAKFRKDYEAHQNDISVIEDYTEQQVQVITTFLNFAYGLPEDETDYQKYVQRIKEADQKAEKEQGKKLLDFSTEEQFLQNRFKRSRNYFSETASTFKKSYHRVQRWVMGLSLAVSVVSLLFIFIGNLSWAEGSVPKWFGNLDNFIVAVISGFAAWLSSNDKLCRNLEFWVKYRTISEALKKEYDLYQGRCGVYDIPDDNPDQFGHTKAEKLFRINYEEIIQAANDSFVSILQSNITVPPANAADQYANSFGKAGSGKIDDVLGEKKGEEK